MILNNTPQDVAVLSNVGTVGEFTIRNSAKAFSILSSGLYANKIRAIIRELSCNAFDSHVSVGKRDVPFEVHLPNIIEPWFSVKDFGAGLSHDQVLNLYTTYFESTKTASNDFIGALGLGSKSPFSYTKTFTVTAIKDGKCGIYSAFINDYGIPSIVHMTTYDTTDENGVEVKFNVDNKYDFYSFEYEARSVFNYFPTKPTILGKNTFSFQEVNYLRRDIIEGIHQKFHGTGSVAVMGNISYPIDVPSSESTLGSLHKYLLCDLEIHFQIGELDFQASREGLSYIPQTVNAIKQRLQQLDNSLYSIFKSDVDAIENEWERSLFIENSAKNNLWKSSVYRYVTETDYKFLTPDGNQKSAINLNHEEMVKKFNMNVRVFTRSGDTKAIVEKTPSYVTVKQDDGTKKDVATWDINISLRNKFVVNDLKTGFVSRTKNHFRTVSYEIGEHSHFIVLLTQADPRRSMDVDGFFASIYNPPKKLIFNSSSFEKSSTAKRVSANGSDAIVRLTEVDRGRDRNYSWKPVKFDFDEDETYYYVRLKGHVADMPGFTNPDNLHYLLSYLPGVNHIYGVRKAAIDSVKDQENWIELGEHLVSYFASLSVPHLVNHYTIASIDTRVLSLVDNCKSLSDDSLFKSVYTEIDEAKNQKSSVRFSMAFAETYIPGLSKMVSDKKDRFSTRINEVERTYPLLKLLAQSYNYQLHVRATLEYISLMDEKIMKQKVSTSLDNAA